jgi:hypothetical protein
MHDVKMEGYASGDNGRF